MNTRTSKKWTTEEDDLLKTGYAMRLSEEEFAKILPKRTHGAILSRASILNLTKQIRIMTDEDLLKIALKFKTKSQFRIEDPSAYTIAKRRGLLDTYAHMSIGVKFNYPQTALFEIMKILYEDSTVIYNDRAQLDGKELDVFVVDHRIAFEYDGAAFHNTDAQKSADKTKDNMCLMKNISLFRIKEDQSFKPIPHILKQLKDYGFDISNISIKDIQDRLQKYFKNLDDIKAIIQKCKSIKELRKTDGRVLDFIIRNGMESLISHLRVKKIPKRYTYDQIKYIILKCSNKTEIIKNHKDVYDKIKRHREGKYKDLWEIYQTLKDMRWEKCAHSLG